MLRAAKLQSSNKAGHQNDIDKDLHYCHQHSRLMPGNGKTKNFDHFLMMLGGHLVQFVDGSPEAQEADGAKEEVDIDGGLIRCKPIIEPDVVTYAQNTQRIHHGIEGDRIPISSLGRSGQQAKRIEYSKAMADVTANSAGSSISGLGVPLGSKT